MKQILQNLNEQIQSHLVQNYAKFCRAILTHFRSTLPPRPMQEPDSLVWRDTSAVQSA